MNVQTELQKQLNSSKELKMSKEERLQDALKRNDFYELAKLTYEGSNNMKIKIKQIKSEETLQRFGNKFFTEIQVKTLRSL